MKIRKNTHLKNELGPKELNRTENLEDQLREEYYREMDRVTNH